MSFKLSFENPILMQCLDGNSANAVLKLAEEQKARRDCLDVLLLTSPYDDRAKLISAKGKRVNGTCEWIKEDRVYCS
jgi:hypothetical protein